MKGENNMKYIKLCEYCKNNRKDDDIWGSGYISWIDDNNYTCPLCQHKLIDTILTSEEDDILTDVSRSASFFDAMIDLKQKDIIEFNLKMSQFKSQVSQTQAQQNNNKDILHCPKCNSTAITTGARGVNNFWGMLGASKTVNRCGSCGFTWKP